MRSEEALPKLKDIAPTEDRPLEDAIVRLGAQGVSDDVLPCILHQLI